MQIYCCFKSQFVFAFLEEEKNVWPCMGTTVDTSKMSNVLFFSSLCVLNYLFGFFCFICYLSLLTLWNQLLFWCNPMLNTKVLLFTSDIHYPAYCTLLDLSATFQNACMYTVHVCMWEFLRKISISLFVKGNVLYVHVVRPLWKCIKSRTLNLQGRKESCNKSFGKEALRYRNFMVLFSLCLSLSFLVSPCLSMFFLVYFCLFPSISFSFLVFPCISLSFLVSPCLFLSLLVSPCLSVSHNSKLLKKVELRFHLLCTLFMHTCIYQYLFHPFVLKRH